MKIRITQFGITPYKLAVFLLIFTVINFENTTILAITPILALLVLFAFAVMQSFNKMITFDKITIWMLLFVVFSFFIKDCGEGGLWSSLGLPQMPITLLLCLITFLCIYSMPQRNTSKDFLIDCYVYSSFVLCLIVTVLLNGDLVGGLHDDAKCEILASYGYNPNNVCVCTAFSSLFLSLKHEGKAILKKPMFWFMVAFAFITGSRKVIVIYAAYFLGYIFLRIKRKIYFVFVSVGILIAGFFAIMYIPFLYDLIGSRFEITFLSIKQVFEGDLPSETRMRMIVIGWNYFKESVFFGNGWASFAERYAEVNQSVAVFSHCNYIEILCSSGIVGFALYYGKFFSAFIQCIKNQKSIVVQKSFGLFLALFAVDVSAVTYYYKPYYILFAIILICMKQGENTNDL